MTHRWALVALALVLPARAWAGVGASVAGGAQWDSDLDYVGFYLDEVELRADVEDGSAALGFGARVHLKARPVDLDGPVGWADLIERAAVWTGQGDAWRVVGGRYMSPLGYESVDMSDVPFATHGIVYNYGSPTTLTGALLQTDPFEGQFVCTAFVANGRDLELPQERLAAGVRLDLGVVDGLNVGLASLLDGPGAGDRLLWLSSDVELDRDPLLLVGEGTWGKQEGDAPGSWAGAMLMGVLRRGRYGASARLEWFGDTDRVHIAEEDGPGEWLAASVALLVGGDEGPEGSHLAFEYRHDRSLGSGDLSLHSVTALLVATGEVAAALPAGGE